METIEQLSAAIFSAVEEYVAKRCGSLEERVTALSDALKGLPPPQVGAPGDKGEKGDKGDPGEKGDIGPQGPVGAMGEKGESGPQGEKGDAGPQGPMGMIGEKGESGPQGEKGDKGEPGQLDPEIVPKLQALIQERLATLKDGKDGERGAQGERGEPGPAGAIGAQGEKGLPGDAGARGEVGEKGDPGARGADGRDGRDALELEIAEMDRERSYVRGDWVKHRGGLLRAFRKTEPLEKDYTHLEEAGWEVMVEGVYHVNLLQNPNDVRELSVYSTLTSGLTTAASIRLPVLIHRGLWKPGMYEEGDVVTRDGSMWVCKKVTDLEPATGAAAAEAWHLTVKHGRDGKDGGGQVYNKSPIVRVK